MLLLMLLHKDSLGEARLMPFNNLIPVNVDQHKPTLPDRCTGGFIIRLSSISISR